MDRAASPSPSSAPARRRKRIPAFHPVPVGPRKDGWTPKRQAHFIGMLAQTGSVLAAARAVGMGRESAYRLRKRRGAAGFAAAWDAALMVPHAPVSLWSAKSTGLTAHERFAAGLLRVIMYGGKFRTSTWKVDDNALLQIVRRIGR